MAHSTALRRFLTTALLGATLASALVAVPQQPGPSGAQGFTWTQRVSDLGSVEVPALESLATHARSGGWFQGPLGTRYRSVPSYTGDPTFEVVISPPYSGNRALPERILIQIPVGFYDQPWSNRAMVVGFHSFSVSEKDIFIHSSLPWECSQRKWLLVAPYGLTDTNFANPRSQASIAAIGQILYSLIPFNYRRVYGVGFSMGGLSALSYAMRHLDPWQLQFAGVVAHTAPLDMRREVQNSPIISQLLLSGWEHFGADYATVPFEYERVSPVRFAPDGLVDSTQAPVINLAHRPVYLHANLADSDTLLVAGMSELASFLTSRGALVQEHLVFDPVAGHSWSTLPVGSALDFVAQYQLPALEPPLVEVFSDRATRWPHVDVIEQSPEAFARYELELHPAAASITNSFALRATHEMERVLFNLEVLGLDPNQALECLHSSADSTADILVFSGYATSPKTVTVNGQPADHWSFEASLQELTVRPSADGQPTVVLITP